MDMQWRNGKRVYCPELLPGVAGPDGHGDLKCYSGLTSDEDYACYVGGRDLYVILAALYELEPPTPDEISAAKLSIALEKSKVDQANKLEGN